MTFYGITIGPIYRTLASVRYTRELWAASYTFSWLMKHIAGGLSADRDKLGIDILLPYVGDSNAFGPATSDKEEKYRLGSGLFPDQIIFRKRDDAMLSDGEIFHHTQDIISATFKQFARKIASHFGWKNATKIETFLDQYFHTYLIQKELADSQNFVSQIAPHLAALELQPSIGTVHRPYLAWFFDRVNSSFLVKDGFGEERVSFETLIEISCRDFEAEEEYQLLKNKRLGKYTKIDLPETEYDDDPIPPDAIVDDRKDDQDDDEKLVKQLSKRDDFLFLHKYVAIVLSDGDNVGKINEMLPLEKMTQFSKDLHEFALDSAQKVKTYGGLPIYAAGDDLMFFAPVIRAQNGEVEDHLFRLLTDLDTDFKARFSNYNTSPLPSLSFGVSITYYKYPLAEALVTARELLFQKAKTGAKNKLALAVLKHSGHEFGGIFGLKEASWQQTKTMLDGKKDWKIIRSIIHKIRENEHLFSLLAKNETQLGYFLDNSFDEEIHGREAVKEWMEEVKALIVNIFNEQSDSKTKFEKLYGALRLISFLNESGSER